MCVCVCLCLCLSLTTEYVFSGSVCAVFLSHKGSVTIAVLPSTLFLCEFWNAG